MSEFANSMSSATSFWDQLSEPMFGPRKSNLKTQFYFLRNLIKECLAALTFLHERGVIHRSIGASSITLNTFDVTQGDNLQVIPCAAPPPPAHQQHNPTRGCILASNPTRAQLTPLLLVRREQVKLRDFGFASRAALLDDGTLRKAQARSLPPLLLLLNCTLSTESSGLTAAGEGAGGGGAEPGGDAGVCGGGGPIRDGIRVGGDGVHVAGCEGGGADGAEGHEDDAHHEAVDPAGAGGGGRGAGASPEVTSVCVC